MRADLLVASRLVTPLERDVPILSVSETRVDKRSETMFPTIQVRPRTSTLPKLLRSASQVVDPRGSSHHHHCYNQKLWIHDLSKGATYPPS